MASFIIAVANMKGGCGKSSIAVNLACELASRGKTVVLIDADVQGTATYYAAQGNLPIDCEHLPLEYRQDVDGWLARVLSIVADYVVLDAPPHVGTATEAIVGVSDLVLIPCTPSTADLVATAPTIDLVRRVRQSRDSDGPRCLLIPSRVDVRTTAGRELGDALKRFKESVGSTVHQRAAFVDAFTAGRWIGDYAPGSDAHKDIAALAAKVERMKRS